MYQVQCHCSGHARSKDLLQIAEEINAVHSIPFNTFIPKIQEEFQNVIEVSETNLLLSGSHPNNPSVGL